MDLATFDHLLRTTRSVRKRLDFTRAVETKVIMQCIDLALQAPTGSNSQGWSFVLITDGAKRRAIADCYRRSFAAYSTDPTRRKVYAEDDLRSTQAPRVVDSAMYLAKHMHEVPVMILACIDGRAERDGVMAQAGLYGSILPAAWSLMLALRSRGLGTAWTTLHLRYEDEVAAMLGMPSSVTQAALFPVAYFTGDDFKPAKRLPARELVHWNTWGERLPSES
jgi:nitroreductase